MTIQVIQAIAALCMMSNSGPLFPLRHEQIKCQQEYLRCYYRLYSPKTHEADVLAACIAERRS